MLYNCNEEKINNKDKDRRIKVNNLHSEGYSKKC